MIKTPNREKQMQKNIFSIYKIISLNMFVIKTIKKFLSIIKSKIYS